MGVYEVAAANAAVTASRSPGLTFGSYTPLENDVVYIVPSSTGTGITITEPSGWVNPLGAGVDVEGSAAHQMCAVYHLVTAAEASGVTTTYTATNLFGVAQTGNVCGVVLRGVDPASVVDSANSTFNTGAVTPSVLASLTGTNLSNGSLVVGCVCLDATGTFTTPSKWKMLTTSNTNQGKWLGSWNGYTTAGTNVAATNITPSVSDQYASIIVAFTALASSCPQVASVGTALSGSSSTTAAYPVPAGVAIGDVIRVVMFAEPSTATVTPATDFVEVPDSPAAVTGGQSHALRLFWKRATAADAGTYTFTLAGLTFRGGFAFRMTGCVASGNPFDVTNVAIKTTTTDGTTPAVSDTTTGANRLWLWANTGYNGGGVGWVAGFHSIYDDGGTNLVAKDQPAAAASGSLTGTYPTNGSSGAWLGAVLPVAVAVNTGAFFNMM